MKAALTAEQMREAEGLAEVGTDVLMERAGEALARAALSHLGREGRVHVVCGAGNNGGDGLVAVWHLLEADVRATFTFVDPAASLSPLAREASKRLQERGLSSGLLGQVGALGKGDVVVDALLGTGLRRPVTGAFEQAIERIAEWRHQGAKVLAADVPSGLQSDTGQAEGACVEADLTVAFGFLKRGHVLQPGAAWSGTVEVADIGLPLGVEERLSGPWLSLLEEEDARATLKERRPDSHKGTYGHVLVVAGSPGKTGAAALSGMAVLRSGAGLVSVAMPANALEGVLAHAPELMGIPLPASEPLGLKHLDALLAAAEGKDALVLGPGLLRDEGTPALLGELLARLDLPMVLDADALNAAAQEVSILRRARGPLVLTPHPGEMARLSGKPTAEVQRSRVETARSFALEHRVTVVLKGSRTLVALEDGRVWVNPTGNAGMATGGSGDVLSGVCGAFLAQGLASAEAASAAVYAHGLAGDLSARHTGQLGLMASDLLAGLCEVWTRWGR